MSCPLQVMVYELYINLPAFIFQALSGKKLITPEGFQCKSKPEADLSGKIQKSPRNSNGYHNHTKPQNPPCDSLFSFLIFAKSAQPFFQPRNPLSNDPHRMIEPYRISENRIQCHSCYTCHQRTHISSISSNCLFPCCHFSSSI